MASQELPISGLFPPTEAPYDANAQIYDFPSGEIIDRPAELQFDSAVTSFEKVGTDRYFRGKGVTSRYEVALSDGSEYKVNIGLPETQVSPIAEASTTPFTTGLNGFNFHHLLKAIEHGFPAIKISAETKWQGELTQARTSSNCLRIIDACLEHTDLNTITQEKSLALTGVSRGAMLALAMRALASYEGRTIPYINTIVPCYPRPAGLGAKELEQLPKEALALGRHLLSLPLPLLSRYPSSLDIHKAGLKYHFAAIPMLTSGEAGTFRHHIPKDAAGYMTIYKDDLMCMGDTWIEDYKDFPNMHIVDASGNEPAPCNAHLRCINYKDLIPFSERQKRLAHELARTTLPAALDFERISGLPAKA